MTQQQNPQDQQEGQYKCSQCGQSFGTQNELKRHEEERYAHGSSGQEKKNEPHRTQGVGSGSQNT